jgi:hypothetical protein
MSEDKYTETLEQLYFTTRSLQQHERKEESSLAILDELNHTHLLESLELQYVRFIQNLECVNIFMDALKDCLKNIDSNMGNRAFILGTKTDFKIIGTGTD